MSDVIRKLQQRIDKRSNDITRGEAALKGCKSILLRLGIKAVNKMRADQALDKRLMGELVRNAKRIADLVADAEFNELINWRN